MKHAPTMLPAVREELAADRKRWPEIAEATGIPFSTIKKIRYGEVSNPGVNTVETLYRFLIGSIAA